MVTWSKFWWFQPHAAACYMQCLGCELVIILEFPSHVSVFKLGRIFVLIPHWYNSDLQWTDIIVYFLLRSLPRFAEMISQGYCSVAQWPLTCECVPLEWEQFMNGHASWHKYIKPSETNCYPNMSPIVSLNLNIVTVTMWISSFYKLNNWYRIKDSLQHNMF